MNYIGEAKKKLRQGGAFSAEKDQKKKKQDRYLITVLYPKTYHELSIRKCSK